MWEAVLTGDVLLWWVTAKSSSCHRQGLYSHAKQGTRVAQRLGIQAQNLIHPAALYRSGIFTSPAFWFPTFSFGLGLGLILEGTPFLL